MDRSVELDPAGSDLAQRSHGFLVLRLHERVATVHERAGPTGREDHERKAVLALIETIFYGYTGHSEPPKPKAAGLSRPMQPLSSITMAGVFALIAGCATPGLEVGYQGEPIEIDAVVIGHLAMHLDGANSWNHYEKLRDALAVIERRERLDAIASFEFERRSTLLDPRDWLRFTTLGPLLKRLKIPEERVIVLMVDLQEGHSKQKTTLDTLRGEKGMRQAKGFYSHVTVRVEAFHPTSDKFLARMGRGRGEDRFADTPDYDNRPAAKATLVDAVDALITSLVEEEIIVPSAPVSPRPLPAIVESPVPVLSAGEDGKRLADHLKTLDPLMQESTLYTRFRYFDPQMSYDAFHRMAEAPPGLWLGDKLATEADGTPIHHTFQLTRMWRRSEVKSLTGPSGAVTLPKVAPPD